MSEPYIPPYTPKPGSWGEKFMAWLFNLPYLGNLFKEWAKRSGHVAEAVAIANRGQLEFWAANTGGTLQEAAQVELNRRFPDSGAGEASRGEWLREFMANPSVFLAAELRRLTDNPTVREITETAGAAIFDSVMGMAIGGSGNIPSDLAERVRRIMGTVVLLTTTPKVAGIIAEATSLGQIDTVGEVFRDAYFNLGLGFVTWQMTSPLIDGGIGQELRRAANKIFRPTQLSWAQVRDLYAMNEMGVTEARNILAEQGYRESDIDRMMLLAYNTLGEGTLMSMWDEGVIGEDVIPGRLRALGYSPSDIPLLMDLHRAQGLADKKETLLGTARAAYKNGLIGATRFREMLSDMGYSEEAISLELSLLDLQRQEEARSLSTSELKAAFLSNVITDVEAKGGLTELGYRSDEIPILIATWIKSQPAKVLRVNKQTILSALARGVLGEPEARGKLAEVGYPPEDVDLIIKTAQAEGLFTKPKAAVGLLIEGARNKIITLVQLEDELRARGFSTFDVSLISGIADFQREIKITPENVLEAYRAGVIDRVAAGQALIAAGLSPDTASMRLEIVTVQIERGKPTVSLGILMGLAANGLLSESDLRTILGEREYSDADITAIVAATLYEPPIELSEGQVLAAYREGVLNRDDAMTKLRQLNVAPTAAQTLLATVEGVMAITQPRASVSVYVAACRDGILTPNELQAKLIDYGLSPEDVELFVQLAVYQPAKPDKTLSKTEVIDAYKGFLFTRVDSLRRLEMLGYAIEDADVLLRLVRRDPEDSAIHILYRAGILSEDQAIMSLAALGYTNDQIITYFEHYRVVAK